MTPLEHAVRERRGSGGALRLGLPLHVGSSSRNPLSSDARVRTFPTAHRARGPDIGLDSNRRRRVHIRGGETMVRHLPVATTEVQLALERLGSQQFREAVRAQLADLGTRRADGRWWDRSRRGR